MGVRCKRRVQGGACGRCKAAEMCGIRACGGCGACNARGGGWGTRAAHPSSISVSSPPRRRSNERVKVTSDLQVPGPSRSWGPVSATPADHRVCARACTRRRVLAPQEKGCPDLLGKSCVALRSKGLGQTFPTRARSEARLVGDPSVGWRGAVQEREAKHRRSSACSTSA